MPSLGSKQRAQRVARQREEHGVGPQQTSSVPVPASCEYCGRTFVSRSKMFKHVRAGAEDGAACMAEAAAEGTIFPTTTERVALLVGYFGEGYAGPGAEYQGHGWQSNGVHGELERVLWEAVATADGAAGGKGKNLSAARLSRASRTDRGVHAAANVASFTCAAQPAPVPATALAGLQAEETALLAAAADCSRRLGAATPAEIQQDYALRTLAIERSRAQSAAADVVARRGKAAATAHAAAAAAWVGRLNGLLPAAVRVFGRWPVEHDFHAKARGHPCSSRPRSRARSNGGL